jgi:hypothetical protein
MVKTCHDAIVMTPRWFDNERSRLPTAEHRTILQRCWLSWRESKEVTWLERNTIAAVNRLVGSGR